MTEKRSNRKGSFVLLYITFLVYCVSICRCEVVLQDVHWTKKYDEGIGENYFGTCRFVESPCGYETEGTCVPSGTCYNRGGWVYHDCQGGIGECCMFHASCAENSTEVSVTELVTNMNLYFDLYSQTSKRCTFKIRKQPDICQVRLDFKQLRMSRANHDGICETDRLRISNSVTVDQGFTACGDLVGQHMYLTFESEDSIDVNQVMSDYIMGSSSIIATMIPCRSKNTAPDYCLQHFTKPSDQVTSFDFGGQQQSNQRYTVCVKPMDGTDSVEWKPCSNVIGRNFDIASNLHAEPLHCDGDWVQFKGQNPVCEPFLSAKSTWKPYELLVNFDESELPHTPPLFIIPTDPGNCAAACTSHPQSYTCSCIDNPDPVNQICQCVVDTPSLLPPTDFNNTGFCLEYTQM